LRLTSISASFFTSVAEMVHEIKHLKEELNKIFAQPPCCYFVLQKTLTQATYPF